MPQAETLQKMLTEWDVRLDVVVELVVDDDEVVRRLSGRRTCRRCGRVWHVLFDPPARGELCDDCGGELFQRDDDREQTIRHRLDVYQLQTQPLIAFYADEGTLLGYRCHRPGGGDHRPGAGRTAPVCPLSITPSRSGRR